jgi:transposase
MVYLLKEKRNKTVSESTVKALLRQEKWKWNRPKHIPPEPEPIKETEKKEILRLLINPEEDEVLFFGDEADFELLPYISGAWMPVGKQLSIPTPGRNQILCGFGFFNPHNKDFFYKLVFTRKQKTAKNFIAALHQIRYLFPSKKIHIVIDNASIHDPTTKVLKIFRETYQQEVFLHFLPKRSPILNPIERFWKFLKQRICCNWLYDSLDSLKVAFRRFIWHYREKFIQYNFQLTKLIQIWKQFPTEPEQIQNSSNFSSVLEVSPSITIVS